MAFDSRLAPAIMTKCIVLSAPTQKKLCRCSGFLPVNSDVHRAHVSAKPQPGVETLRFTRPQKRIGQPRFGWLLRGSMLAFSAANVWGMVRNSQTVRCAVRAATLILEQHGIPEAAESAEYIAISTFEKVQTRRDARTLRTKPAASELDRYVTLCDERKRTRKPIQYLVGDWDFHNITLLVRPPVLIPRPETEELVEHLIADVKNQEARILDVGCGSGAILLAALSARPGWRAVGVDVSKEAVALSLDNVSLLKMKNRVDIRQGTVAAARGEELFDALVSNPPYILTKDLKLLDIEVRQHEDCGALCGGEDGLDVVREILNCAPSIVKPGGSVWLELDSSHPERMERMKFDGLTFVNRYDDMYGRARFCQFRVCP